MRSSTAVGLAVAGARITSMPRYIIGAVSRKISSSTSTTSTSGMMLISARLVPIRRPPSDGPALNAIFRGPRKLRRRPAEHIQHVERKPVHLGCPMLHTIDEVVVADDGRDGSTQACGRGDERLRDAWRDDREARRALRADAMEGVHDADDGAEQADERARAGGRREERQIALELRDLQGRRATHGPIGGLQALGAPVVRVLDERLGVVTTGHFVLRGDVELGERALAKLLGGGRHHAGPPALAEHLEEPQRLPPHAPELPPFLYDEGPADDGK